MTAPLVEPATPSRRVAGEKAARLAIVQALYQMEHAGATVPVVKMELRADRLGLDAGEQAAAEMDLALFDRVIDGVVAHQDEIDSAIREALAQNWRLERVASVARAILRAGTFELRHDWRADRALVIDAWVGLSRAFFDDPEPGFINGVLDRLSRMERPAV